MGGIRVSERAKEPEKLFWRNWRAGALCFSSLLRLALLFEVFLAVGDAKFDVSKTLVALARRSCGTAAPRAPFVHSPRAEPSRITFTRHILTF